jgi:hypothetical protein
LRLAGLWAYSMLHWLRHAVPSRRHAPWRWHCSPFWLAIQTATPDGQPTPLERHRKVQGELTLLRQMLAGDATSAAAFQQGILLPRENAIN